MIRYKTLTLCPELITVGSYVEGTKNFQPDDEFDYLAVIEGFSKPNTISIDVNENEIQSGLVNIVVEDEEVKSKCSGHLTCFQPINYPEKEESRFGHVGQVLLLIVKRSEKLETAFRAPTDIACNILLHTVNNTSLHFKGIDLRVPNVFLKFEYQTMEVTADVLPVIRYHNIDACFREK